MARRKNCIRCGYALYYPDKKIHPECAKLVQSANTAFLFEHLPYLLDSPKEVAAAQGMAFECDTCYRVVLPYNSWSKLSQQYQVTIGAYTPSMVRTTTCSSCQNKSTPAFRNFPATQRNPYRRNVVSSSDVEDIIEANRARLSDAGLVVGDYINRGEDGAVYYSSPGSVIKFSVDSEEARIAAYLQEHWHPSFPRIYGVWDISEFCGVEAPLAAIWREDISSGSSGLARQRMVYLGNFLLGKAGSSEYTTPAQMWNIVHAARDRYEQFVEELREEGLKDRIPWFAKQFSRLKKLVLWMRSVQLYAGDIGGDNWGWRDDTTLVVRDFGQFSFSIDKKPLIIPKL